MKGSPTRRGVLGGLGIAVLSGLSGCQVTIRSDSDGFDVNLNAGGENVALDDPFTEPVDPRPQRIERVETSTVAFVGRPASVSERGSTAGASTSPVAIRSFQEYVDRFADPADSHGVLERDANGDLARHKRLAWSVRLFFDNGGGNCYVLPLSNRIVPTVADLAALDAMDDVSLLVVPGATSRADHDPGLTYLDRRPDDLFYVGYLPRTGDPDAAPRRRSTNAAIYYPWVTVVDPTDPSSTLAIPPAGAVAGIYARTDRSRGVHRAPAGVGATVVGIAGLDRAVPTDQQVGPVGARVNPIVSRANVGDVVWGARTYGTDPTYRFVSTRRTMTMIRRSVEGGTHWVETTDGGSTTRSRVEDSVTNFLTDLWREGAFQGAKPSDAFFVAVPRPSSNRPDELRIEVGVAPLKPAEFVRFAVVHPLE